MMQSLIGHRFKSIIVAAAYSEWLLDNGYNVTIKTDNHLQKPYQVIEVK
jgi:hypothetical protein